MTGVGVRWDALGPGGHRGQRATLQDVGTPQR